MGNSIGNTDKKSKTTSKNKIEEEHWNILGQKGKKTKVKQTI